MEDDSKMMVPGRFQDDETQFGEWPHMCAILEKRVVRGTRINLFACGGSLVAPGVVLTAAHCAQK